MYFRQNPLFVKENAKRRLFESQKVLRTQLRKNFVLRIISPFLLEASSLKKCQSSTQHHVYFRHMSNVTQIIMTIQTQSLLISFILFLICCLGTQGDSMLHHSSLDSNRNKTSSVPKLGVLFNSSFEDSNGSLSREKRSYSHERYIELLIVADSKMEEYHQDNLESYILTLMNTVSPELLFFKNH